ncbi:MAG: rod-binding protein [Nitrospirae bacterium]|nr:rod-binding protein [Nitrospirota bacterium]
MDVSALHAAAPAVPRPGKGVSNAQAAKEMEALFVTQLIKAMRQTVPESGLMSGGRGEELARTMQDDAMGKAVAAAGGIGLSRQLLQDLDRVNPQAAAADKPEQSPGPNGTP